MINLILLFGMKVEVCRSKSSFMIKNYLLISVRNLIRNKVLTFVNIAGLAFGLLCSLLMFFWVWDEIRTDKFHNKIENIYQVFGEVNNAGEKMIWKYAPSAMAGPIKDRFPEVKDICRVFPASVVFENDNIKFIETGIYSDPSLFSIFSFPLKEGNPTKVLRDPNSIVITSELAEKYFPGESAIGRNIGIVQDQMANYVIGGVMEPIPPYSSLQFDFVLPYDQFELSFRPWWGDSNPYSYNNFNVTLYAEALPGVDAVEINKKLETFIADFTLEESSNSLFVYPFGKTYLHSDFSQGRIPTGKIRYVKLLSIIAVIVLLIACINFTNLSTAIAGQRAKEVGVRKAVGASRKQLVIQFMFESIMISFCSMAIALTFAEVLLPLFNFITQKQIDIPFSSPEFILVSILVLVFTGILAGVYPSFVLSSFNPLKSLTGHSQGPGGLSGMRRGLVFIQFTLSISFIIYTLVVHDQIDFIQSKELGIRKNNMLYHNLNSIRSHSDSYKNELLKMGGVESVSFTEQDPFNTSNGNLGVTWDGKDPNSTTFFNVIQVSEDFLRTFEIELDKGEGFSGNYSSDNPKQYLINEAAAEAIGSDDLIGMRLQVWGYEGIIKGVVQNYNHQSLEEGIEPIIIILSPDQTWTAYIGLNTNDIQNTVNEIKSVYEKYESEYPFDYYFADDQFQATYRDTINVGKLSRIFSTVAIIISCLGLFGLSAFIIEQKRMETGIRKVLGASQPSLIYLFTIDFVKLVFYSFLVAAPLSWIYTNQWLSGFAFHSDIGFAPFLIAGTASIVIALVTVGYHTVKAGRLNPVDLLRDE